MSNILESKQPTVTSEPQKVVAQKNLLLVEDVRVSQRVARVALNRARFRVDIAMDGLEAVELYSKGKFDVILMDIQVGFQLWLGVPAFFSLTLCIAATTHEWH